MVSSLRACSVADLREIESVGHLLLRKHNLPIPFGFHRDQLGGTGVGACDFTGNTYQPIRISIDQDIAKINSVASCEQIILHEIAHGIAGYFAEHNQAWKTIASDIGVRNPQPYADFGLLLPQGDWNAYCPECSLDHPIDTENREPMPGLYECPEHAVKIFWLPRGLSLAEKMQVTVLDRPRPNGAY